MSGAKWPAPKIRGCNLQLLHCNTILLTTAAFVINLTVWIRRHSVRAFHKWKSLAHTCSIHPRSAQADCTAPRHHRSTSAISLLSAAQRRSVHRHQQQQQAAISAERQQQQPWREMRRRRSRC